MTEMVMVRDTANYRVTYYPKPSRNLTVVFISAGRSAPGEPVEEFKRTLDRFDTATVFVLDRNALWFNYEETTPMWAELALIAARYVQVATIGESMGGCGALIARKALPNVGRTLAMSPQYSITKPFINFDDRYEPVSRAIKAHRYVHFSDAPNPEGCVVLYGTLDWRDYLHSVMFSAHGFRPIYLTDATHNVAAFLKSRPGNGLVALVSAFLDWSRPFDSDTVATLFPGLTSLRGMDPEHGFAAEATRLNHALPELLARRHAADTGQTLGRNLALGMPATQSSLSPWSRGPTLAQDAAGAVNGVISGSYAFHTGLEVDPWWRVDLGQSCALQEVRVFNFIADTAVMERAAALSIDVSEDDVHWTTVYRRTESAAFGGADGAPLVWRPAAPCAGRYVRITAAGQTYLHLDQVQVFGRR